MFNFLTSFLNLWLVFILGGGTGWYPRECKVTIFVVVLFLALTILSEWVLLWVLQRSDR